MPRNDRRTVLTRQELVFQLRSQHHVPWQAVAQKANCSLSQAQKDHRQFLERWGEETIDSDGWVLEQEARYDEVAFTAWTMIGQLKRQLKETTRDDATTRTQAPFTAGATTQALFAIDRFLRTVMVANDRITELRRLRLGGGKREGTEHGEMGSVGGGVSPLKQDPDGLVSVSRPAARSQARVPVEVAPEEAVRAVLQEKVLALETPPGSRSALARTAQPRVGGQS